MAVSNAFTFRMPVGYPGDVNRAEIASVEAQQITPFGTSGAPPAAGLAVVIDATSGMVRVPTTGDVANAIYGVLVREYPQQSTLQVDALGNYVPVAQGACSVLKRGYIMVQLGGTTPATKNGAVFVRIAGAATGKVIGDFEALADGGNTVALPTNTCYFTGAADSNGITELAFNI
jgi:hypothetical protein